MTCTTLSPPESHVPLERDRLLATLGHEMRTPLNAILGFVGLMLAEPPEGGLSPDHARQLAIVQRCGEELLALSNDLLEAGRLAEGGVALLRPEPIDVRSLLDELQESLAPLAREKALALATHVADDAPPVHADRGALRRILVNLVGNAIKYTDRGHVTVRARRTGGALRLSVRDTGIGITREDRSRLFKAFTQVGDAVHRHDGAGLGLHICARLAQSMGARIDVRSTPGRGSDFTLVLPLRAA